MSDQAVVAPLDHIWEGPEPIEGITPGTIFPGAEFPDELFCPFCDETKKFKNASGLRGHAYSKHGIRWDLPKSRPGGRLAHVKKLPQGYERTTLKPWHMIAIANHELYGLSWEEIGRRMGRSSAYLRDIAKSPAAEGMRAAISEVCDTPEKIALLLMKSQTVSATMDYMMALDWAKEAKDYNAVHKMTRELLTLAGAEDRKSDPEPPKQELHIHLDATDMRQPIVTTSFEKVVEAEVID